MASNQYVNKVQFDSTVLIDLTSDTATAADVASGKYFHLATGERVQGTATGGSVTQDANGYIVLPSTGGGGGGGSWSWMGKNPTLVKAYAKEKVYFKDTAFPNWTWSTTASDIVAAVDYGETFTADFTQYDCLLTYKLYVHTDYGNWTPVAAVMDFAYVCAIDLYGYYTSLSAKRSGVYDGVTSMSLNKYVCQYKNSSGKDAFGTFSYGLYSTSVPTYSSSGDINEKTLTISKLKLQARGSNSYFTQNAFNNVDMDASYYEVVTEVWRMDDPTSNMASVYELSLDVLDNGL